MAVYIKGNMKGFEYAINIHLSCKGFKIIDQETLQSLIKIQEAMQIML